MKNLSILAQDKLENYQRLYDGYIKRCGIWSMYFGWTKEYVTKCLKNITQFFHEHGITETDFFPEDFDISKKSEECLKTIAGLVKDGTVSQERAQAMVAKNIE